MSNLESDYLEDDAGSAKSEQVTRGSATDKSTKSTGGIESVSNKRMRLANINPWTLRYNDESLESKVQLEIRRRCSRNLTAARSGSRYECESFVEYELS